MGNGIRSESRYGPARAVRSRDRFLAFVAFCAVSLCGFAATAQNAAPQTPALLLGTAWYPEQWP